MKTDIMEPQPMNEDQLNYVKEQIKQTYLFLISHSVASLIVLGAK